jgi:hypothetical protein
MSGVQTSYNAQNCDVRKNYAEHEQCIVRLWLPAGYRSLEDMPVYLKIPGGGWNAPHADATADIHDPTGELIAGGDYIDDLLTAGWAVGRMEWPHGANVDIESRVHPTSRWPALTVAIGRCVQFLKTHALDGLVTGSTASTLATSHLRYILEGTSSSGIDAMNAAFLPDGGLRYQKGAVYRGGGTTFNYRYNHRVRGVVNSDGGCDFRKWASNAVSADALPRFGPRENFYVNPALGNVPNDQKRVCSPLWLAERAYPENLDLGVFCIMDEGSVPNGQSAPAVGAVGSFLGSGTTLVYLNAAQTGTFQVGETVTGATTGTGTVKGRKVAGPNTYLYVERTTTATFAGVVTGGTSGATITATYECGGNNDRLAFLSPAQALAVWDAAGDGEIADCTAVHEQIHAPALKRQLEANGDTLSRFYIANDYVAGLTGGYTPAFTWNDLTLGDEILDWLENGLGITP